MLLAETRLSFCRRGSPLTVRRSTAATQTTAAVMTTRATLTEDQSQMELQERTTLEPVVTSLPTKESLGQTADGEGPPVRPNVCDKCHDAIRDAAEGLLAGTGSKQGLPLAQHVPPPADQPWVSKIPRPVNTVAMQGRLRAAISVGHLCAEAPSPKGNLLQLQRSKSNLTPTLRRRTAVPLVEQRIAGTPPPHPQIVSLMGVARRVPSPLARSASPLVAKEQKSFIPKLNLAAAGTACSSRASSGMPSPVPETRSVLTFLNFVDQPIMVLFSHLGLSCRAW